MHTLKLNIPDIIYPETISFLKKYPTVSIDKNIVSPDFIISDMEEAKRRVQIARDKNEFIEEQDFWDKIDEHISKI